jgi:hypothetical protein
MFNRFIAPSYGSFCPENGRIGMKETAKKVKKPIVDK